MELKLSILITVYNQIEILKKNIDQIVRYTGNDIEIVISDNASTDNIKLLVSNYNDKRIKYFRLQENVGQDLNIVYGIEHCMSPYILLLRTRDFVIPEKISVVIDEIYKNPSCSYFLFSAKGGENYVSLKLENKIYKKGTETIKETYKLLIHPSGQIYRRKDLRPDLYRQYLLKYFDNDDKSFIVHELIRMDLSVCGDFYTSSIDAWLYANSLKAKDKSVNMSKIRKGVSPYHPSLQYPRYLCQMDFAYNEQPKQYNLELCRQIINSFLRRVTFEFAQNNRIGIEAIHYGTEKISFDVSMERRTFKARTLEFVSSIDESDNKKIKKHLYKQLLVNLTYHKARDFARMMLKEKRNNI
jgi:glycosyltransferase involved in cell wall biosynthesis